MNIPAQQVKQLTAIGFLAACHGLTAEGETIFEGLKLCRPESEYPPIGLAMTKIGARQYDAALAILTDQALKLNPASATAKCFVGLALKLAGSARESERWLKEAAAMAEDREARALAESLLDETA